MGAGTAVPYRLSSMNEPESGMSENARRAARECWDAFRAHECSFDDGIAVLAVLYHNIVEKSGEDAAVITRRWTFHCEQCAPENSLLTAKVKDMDSIG